jgi:hypothetical protein
MLIINDDSSILGKWRSKLTDDTRVVIYDHNMFIIQATDHGTIRKYNILLISNLEKDNGSIALHKLTYDYLNSFNIT